RALRGRRLGHGGAKGGTTRSSGRGRVRAPLRWRDLHGAVAVALSPPVVAEPAALRAQVANEMAATLMRGWLILALFIAAWDGWVRGSCDSGAQLGYVICDQVAFSEKTAAMYTQSLSRGICPCFISPSPTATLPRWQPGGVCPPGAVGSCFGHFNS